MAPRPSSAHAPGSWFAFVGIVGGVVGCGDDAGGGGASSTASATGTTTAGSTTRVATTSAPSSTQVASSSSGTPTGDFVVGGARPATVKVPQGFDPSAPRPLVVLLHGYTASGAIQDAYFGMSAEANARGMLFVAPDGTTETGGNRFWNATDACCNFYGSTVDDSSYLAGLVDEIATAVAVDPKRVFFVGHSNGGFMSYRMACDHADKIAAIASLAGATFADAAACDPSAPVSVLQIHGTADATVAYEGGSFGAFAYPSAPTTTQAWAAYDGCAPSPEPGPQHDVDGGLPGNETTSAIYSGCTANVAVELWTIAGGGHVPSLSGTFAAQVLDFLEAHPKP